MWPGEKEEADREAEEGDTARYFEMCNSQSVCIFRLLSWCGVFKEVVLPGSRLPRMVQTRRQSSGEKARETQQGEKVRELGGQKLLRRNICYKIAPHLVHLILTVRIYSEIFNTNLTICAQSHWEVLQYKVSLSIEIVSSPATFLAVGSGEWCCCARQGHHCRIDRRTLLRVHEL